MCWTKAAMREDRQQAYFDAILMNVSETGGNITRERLIKKVARELKKMGDTAWHVDRMVATMIRGRCLVRKKDKIALRTVPGAQTFR